MSSGPAGSRRGDLIGPAAVTVVLLAPLAVIWLAGVLGGLLGDGRPLPVGLGESARIITRLPGRLGEPELAWPARQRARLPDSLELKMTLALSTLVVLALLAVMLATLARLAPNRAHGRAARFAARGQLRDLRLRRPQAGRVNLGVQGRGLIAAESRASILVVGPSQSGKTRGLVVPALLEWQGPVISTSVKSDTVHETHAARRARGQVKIFDPTGSCGLAQSSWSPVAASRSWTAARRTAARLLGVGEHAGARSADEAFWRPAGARFLAPLLMAAAHGQLTMREVLSWTATSEEDTPSELLRCCPDPGAQPALDALRSVWDADPRFRSSLVQTVATALDAWQEPQVASATIGDSRISSDWLLSGPNTLYLVSPADDQRRLRGLFVALLTDITTGAFTESTRTGKPLDPPLLVCLDEAANIAPLANLDELASTGAGQGVQLLTVFQDISQAAERWGRERAETIIANHRARLFTPGIGDRATLDLLAHTLGEEEVARISTHRTGLLSAGSRTLSSEFRTLAPANRVREQAPDTALLVYGRLAPSWINLRPWYADRGLRALAAAAGNPVPRRVPRLAGATARRLKRALGATR